MTDSDSGSESLFGCSIKGPSHEADDIPCQDAWDGRRLSDGRYVFAVADGLGEANLSHEGSAQATKEVVSALEDRSETLETLDEESTREILKESFIRARAALAEEAEQRGEQPSEFLTTLLAVIIGPSGVAGAVVGDGGIVYDCRDSYELLVPREMAVMDLPSSNVTIPLQHDDWEQSFRFGYREACDGVAVFTDGFDEFVWDGLDSANAEFFSSVFELVRNIEEKEEAEQRMAEIFDNEPYSKYSSDDKTLAVANVKTESTPVPDSDTAKSSETPETDTASSATSESNSSEEYDQLKTSDGEVLCLATQLESDARGSVFSLADTSGVVKLFKPDLRGDKNLKNKLLRMSSTPPWNTTAEESHRFVWPTNIVTDPDEEQFVGYKSEVPRPELQEWTNILDYAVEGVEENRAPRRSFGEELLSELGLGGDSEFTREYTIATELAEAVATLHRDGHAIGNFHHNRVLTDGQDIVLTGCETFHTRGENTLHEGARPSSRYAPVDERDSNENLYYTDQFGLAVHIFQLLMDGFHPFQTEDTTVSEAEEVTLIECSSYPYHAGDQNNIEPPSGAPNYSTLPSEIQELFEQCFIEAQTQPDARPSADDWVRTLNHVR